MAYIDTCAKSSVASYSLYTVMKSKGYKFQQETASITLADGHRKTQNILTMEAPVSLCNRTIQTKFLVLPEAKNNRTLLGIGFIQDAGMVLNLPQFTWHFIDQERDVYELYDENFTSFKEDDVTLSPFQYTSSGPDLPQGSVTETFLHRPYGPLIPIEASTPPKRARTPFDGYSPIMDTLYRDAQRAIAEDDFELSPDSSNLFPSTELFSLDVDIKTMDQLLKKNAAVFMSNGKPTTQTEHHIDTGTHNPIAVPPYRLSPMKTEILRKEIDKMLENGIIEPCVSPWSSPVVCFPRRMEGLESVLIIDN